MTRNANPKLPKLQKGYNPRRIMPFGEWCALNDLSTDLGRRIINGLTDIPPPKVTQLSERRIGIRADHNAEWQDARIRTGEPKRRAEKVSPQRSRNSQIAAE